MKKYVITYRTKYGREDVFVTEAESEEAAINEMRTGYLGPIGDIFRTAEIISVKTK